MKHPHRLLGMIGVFLLLTVVASQQVVYSQFEGTLQPGFGPAFLALRHAESAGATADEVSALVAQLNSALALNREALTLTAPQDAEKRTALLAQADQILSTVTDQATELATTSFQRAHTNQLLWYVWSLLAAALGTILYIFAVSLRRRYWIKRTLEMKVTPR